MNKGRELTIEEIKNLKNMSKVYIDYLDEEEFDLEYCNTLHINTYCSKYSEFEDYDRNTFKIDELISYIKKGQIKVYKTEDTKISEIKPITNYERIKSMTIEEMAKSRVYINYDDNTYINDTTLLDGEPYINEYSAIKSEINWLKQEVE